MPQPRSSLYPLQQDLLMFPWTGTDSLMPTTISQTNIAVKSFCDFPGEKVTNASADEGLTEHLAVWGFVNMKYNAVHIVFIFNHLAGVVWAGVLVDHSCSRRRSSSCR